ncbi:MAG: hypothetical protein RIC56_09570 [Pseudomonadales bacterium]
MKLRILNVLCGFALASTLAHAGPGWDVTSFSTAPQNAPKLVAAIDEWMAAGGSQFPGQVTLYANEADGDDPATHTIVATFPSVAANEAFSQKVQNDEKLTAQWAKLIGVFSANTTVVETTRGSFVRSWGDVDTGDSAWIHHFVTVSDPAGMVAAMDQWMNSATGKKAPGQLHLSSVVAGGMGSPSHIVSIGYANQAEMETWNDSLAGNAEFAAYIAKLQSMSEYHGANMAIRVKTWGNDPVAATASR